MLNFQITGFWLAEFSDYRLLRHNLLERWQRLEEHIASIFRTEEEILVVSKISFEVICTSNSD
jgi:hypothetical protein